MPSAAARLLGFSLRHSSLVNRWLWGGDLETTNWGRRRRLLCRSPNAAMNRTLSVRVDRFHGREVWTIGPRGSDSPVHVLYWHGGGFVFGPVSMHWRFISRMVTEFGFSFTVPLYPLAPEAQSDRTTGFALDFYRQFVATVGTENMVMAGDSAGGMLATVTALLARDAGLPLPEGLLLISPALDGARTDHPDYPEIRKRDHMLPEAVITALRDLYVGDVAADDIRVCPINGDFSDFPPMQVFAGSDDVLVLGTRALKRKCAQIDYVEGEGLFHCWPLMPIPEAHGARTRMGAFVRRVCSDPRPAGW